MKALTYLQLGRHGRLGNQMWQIAGTFGLAQSLGIPVGFPEWSSASYFNVPTDLFRIPPSATNLFPDYMQDLNYFKGDLEQTIRSFFAPSDQALEIFHTVYGDIDFSEMTAIHIRRGDYLGLPNHHPVCPLDYYEQALSVLDSHKLFVCSDDISWCQAQSIFGDALFGDGPNEAIDLLAMSFTKSQVISNSTFSWWSAFLSSNYRTLGTVAYPKRWYGPEVSADYTLMIADLPWIGIEFQDTWGIG